MVQETKIDKALDAYGDAYSLLWEQVQEHQDQFPSGTISVGTIAEYFAKKYLEEKHQDSDVTFGSANEKAWDIKVTFPSKKTILYQVKSVSDFNQSRKLSPLTKGFDKLIVIYMDCSFFPIQAHMFEDSSVLFGEHKVTALTVPNPENQRQRGSKLFSFATDISGEFFDILADKL